MAKTTQRYPTGVRAGSKGGIEIRWSVNRRHYSEYIDQAPTPAALRRAARLRKTRMEATKEHGATGVLFSTVVSEFLEAKRPWLAHSTHAGYSRVLRRHWLPAFGGLPIQAIGHPEIRGVVDSLDRLSRRAARNVLIPLRQVLKWALFDREYIAADPSARTKIPQGQRPQPDPFSRVEREAILMHIKRFDAQAWLFYLIAFEAGLRCPSEILALRWQDFDGRTLAVSKARVMRRLKPTTKTNTVRHVLVTKRLATQLAIAKKRATGEWLFARRNGKPVLDADRYNSLWRAALQAAGVRYRRAYNCRHTYASLGLKAGAKPAFLADQLGHTLPIFYSVYARWIRDASDRAELQLIEQYLAADR